MLVFWKEKLVILAVPKTGSTALQQALAPRASVVFRDPPGLKHANLMRYRRFVLPMLAQIAEGSFETVAVVRHPVDWLGSWFRYRARPEIDSRPQSTAGTSFDAFVNSYLTEPPPEPARVGSQARFISDRDGRVGVDRVFRYESPERFRSFLSDRLQWDPDLPLRNVSPPMETALSADLVTRLENEKPAEFSIWNRAEG